MRTTRFTPISRFTRYALNLVIVCATIVLVALKYYDIIDWSWWWVLALLWAPIALFIGAAVMYELFALVMIFIYYTHQKTT